MNIDKSYSLTWRHETEKTETTKEQAHAPHGRCIDDINGDGDGDGDGDSDGDGDDDGGDGDDDDDDGDGSDGDDE